MVKIKEKKSTASSPIHELMKLKEKDFFTPSTLRDSSSEEGVLFIRPPVFLNLVKKAIKDDPESIPEKQVKKILGVFKELKKLDFVKKFKDHSFSGELQDWEPHYITMIKEFRETDDPELKKLAKKGFPLEFLTIPLLAQTKDSRQLKEIFNLFSNQSELFNTVPRHIEDRHIEDNARIFNEISSKLGDIKFTKSERYDSKRRKAKKEPVIEELPIKGKVYLNDAARILNETFRHTYKRGVTEATALTSLGLKCPDELLETYFPNLKPESISLIYKFWDKMGKITPKKIKKVNGLFHQLSQETQKKIFSRHSPKTFLEMIPSGLYPVLEKIKPEKEPKKEHEYIEEILAVPKELVSPILEHAPKVLKKHIDELPEKNHDYWIKDKKVGGFGYANDDERATVINGIELDFEGMKKRLKSPGPRLEEFREDKESREHPDHKILYSLEYPQEYKGLMEIAAGHLKDLDPSFEPFCQKIMSAKGMKLTGCVDEFEPEFMNRIESALATEGPLKKLVDSAGNVHEMTEDELREIVPHFVTAPEGGTHSDVIEELLKQNTENLRNTVRELEKFKIAKKLIDDKVLESKKKK